MEKAWHAQQAGAKAVVVADNVAEPLLTMAAPGEDHPDLARLVAKLTIPTSLVTKEAGDQVKAALGRAGGRGAQLELDWSDAIANPGAQVDWEFW